MTHTRSPRRLRGGVFLFDFMAKSALSAGHVLVGRYQLESQLGAGGMGTIWRALHLVLNAPVAVKLIERDVAPDEETTARFLREAQSAAALRSPHVVQILDYGIDGTIPFIAMELLEGENLAQRLKRVSRLTPAETLRILSHVARAIGRAHEAGIVHRDLKPENVFIVHNEDEEIAKVLDFGVAKVAPGSLGPEGTRTRTGSILGTPYYMSPEQAQGNRTVDYRSDLWSMGVIAFECLTGKRPFYSDGLGDLVLAICVRDIPVPSEVATVPLGFDEWWKKAVAREPENRFQSAREMIDALREVFGIEQREVQTTAPEIVVTSADPDSLAPPPSRAATQVLPGPEPALMATAAAPPSLPRPPATAADVHAATLAVPSGELPALTERQFGTAQKSVPPPRNGGRGLVVVVAALALAAGLGVGLYALRSSPSSATDRPLPAPLPEAAHAAESIPKARPKSAKTEPSAAGTASAGAPAPAEASAAPADPSEKKPSSSATPAASASAASAPSAAPSAAPASTAEAPDAGWVKPEWAIPDGDPIRRQPIDE